jgi:hypothetical protein
MPRKLSIDPKDYGVGWAWCYRSSLEPHEWRMKNSAHIHEAGALWDSNNPSNGRAIKVVIVPASAWREITRKKKGRKTT